METEWDAASPEAEDDMHALFDEALDLAAGQLAKYGRLLPFAMTVGDDGRNLIGIGDEAMQPPQMVDELWRGLCAEPDGLRAVIVVADVRLQDGGDAIRFQLEHSEGVADEVFVPYTRARLRRRLSLGNQLPQRGTRRIWPDA